MCYHLFCNEILLDLKCAGFQIFSCRVPGPGTRNSELGTVDSNVGGQNLASRRATQASHPGFNVLQDNLSAIKGHVKTAPAALFKQISTSDIHLSSPGSRNSELGPRHSEVGMLHSNFGGRKWVSHREMQVSHPGVNVLQVNLSTIKGHVKRAPALFRKISTLVGHLTRQVLMNCVKSWVPELGTRTSALGSWYASLEFRWSELGFS